MAETYSLAVTGQRADQEFAVAAYKVGDTVGADGNHNLAQMLNKQILCKGPDGSQRYYTIDSTRSTPSNLVLLPVGP